MAPNAWLRFDLLRPALDLEHRSRVLEIGPGRGGIAARMVAAGHDYTGIEMSEDAREASEQLLSAIPGGRYQLLESPDELDGCAQFDLVYAFEVLEHIADDTAALTAWVRRLRPGGLLLLSVPAFRSRYSATDREVGHVRRYDPEDLVSVADAAGLVDIRVRTYGFPLGYLLEWVRNIVSGRLHRARPVGDESPLDRTKRSGAWLQPPPSAHRVIRAMTFPFRLAQRPVTTKGTGLVLSARAPSSSAD